MSRDGFGLLPSVKFNRSKFTLSHGVKTTLNVGQLAPVDIQEILPGDSFKVDMNAVARVTSAFIKPVMDNLWLDVFHFFVPLRLCQENAEQVFGKASPSMYVDDSLESFAVTEASSTVSQGTVADYLGLPLGSVPKGISLMPFRAFARIYNEWFRNENIVDETYVNMTGSQGSNEVINNNPWSPTNYMGQLPYVSKKKDYFTSCLPNTQKGQAQGIPINVGQLPVITDNIGRRDSVMPLQWLMRDNNGTIIDDWEGALSQPVVGLSIFKDGTKPNQVTDSLFSSYNLMPSNLVADGTNSTGNITVNDLRFAFQFQKMLERDALYGSRYNEYLLGHFGVTNPDARLQFTEYLGGGRIPIDIQQVAQTSQGSEDSPLANVGGYSLSNGKSRYSKGFTEHGYILTVACIRTMHTYSQGVPKLFMRSERNEFYDPLYANLGEQPVYTSELFASNQNELRENVFGYNEAWAEYRYSPNRVSGFMRPQATDSLAIWSFTDNYQNQPYLTSNFIEETPLYVDRTLAVKSTVQPQFMLDLWFKTEAIRVMPTYSVPGLIDHH